MIKGFGPQKEVDFGYDPAKGESNSLPPKEWDVVDPENAYNLPGFDEREEQEFFDVVDQEDPEADAEDLMAKYELEEFELNDWAKKCAEYVNGRIKTKPLKNEADILAFASYYHEHLDSDQNNSGLPLSSEQLARLSAAEQDKLEVVLDKLSDFYDQMADDTERRSRNFSTSRSKENRFDSQLSTVDKLNNHYRQIQKAQKDLEALLNKAYGVEEKKEAEAIERSRPEYTDFELESLKSCFDYLTRQSGAKLPTWPGESKSYLSPEQILKGAREYAEYNRIPQAKFLEKEFKGRRQLVYTEYLKGGKQIKYICNDPKQSSGDYYFQANVNNFWDSKKNPNLRFAQARLLFSASSEKPKATIQKKSA